MKCTVRFALSAVSLALVTTICLFKAAGDEPGPRDIPPALAPFEYLVGQWKGQGVPKDRGAKQFRGWLEVHTWAWAFVKGKPVGLTLSIEGGKVLTGGKLTFDAGRKRYRFEGTERAPSAQTLIFDGTLDKTGKLVLDHVGAETKPGKSAGTMRLSLWPNANFIRYTMGHDLKEPGAVLFFRLVEVGLTRDGESLAGPATTAERPKCIVTGGAANMTMTYQGRTFAICCTGCRDEFNDNPEKYIKKASLMQTEAAGKAKSSRPAAVKVGRFDDAFAGDVVDSPEERKVAPAAASEKMAKSKSAADAAPAHSGSASVKKSAKKDDDSAAAKQASRATALLKLGQSLDRAGKTTAALEYYRRVVKDYAQTPAAKTAAERIKALEGQ